MVIEKIFENARKTPDKIAVFWGDQTISYAAFAALISHARQLLVRQQLPVGSIAALFEVSLIDAWVFGLALRSLGITTIAVPSLASLDEIGLRNMSCAITTKHDRRTQILPTCNIGKVIQVPPQLRLESLVDDVPGSPAVTAPNGGHILVTSGTTGVRKKVLIDDACLSAGLPRRADGFEISERSIVNVFDFNLWSAIGYYIPLCVWSNGAAVVIQPDRRMHRCMLVDGITHSFSSPSTLSILLNAPPDEVRYHETMKLFVGGGPLPQSVLATAEERLTPIIYTVIGSTEVAPWALTRIYSPQDLSSHCIHPSVEVQVVDDSGRPLPVGQIGVVRVRAVDGVMGYLDDEEASHAHFRDGYFYPGDLGMFREGGRFVLQGRVTNVVNVLGKKIAAELIELGLQDRLKVDGVCVLSIPNEAADEELHVMIQSRLPVGATEIASALGAELGMQIQARIHIVAALPRNEMGKIDRPNLRRQIIVARKE